MKESKINHVLKGLFLKASLFAVVLITLTGTQLGQARDSVQRKSDDNRGSLVVGDIKASSPCPAGEVLMAYHEPIYNEEGTLVIGWEKIWRCFPEDFKPVP